MKKEINKMKKMSIIAALLMVVAVTTLAMAGPRNKFFDGRGHSNPAVIETLELTNEQTGKIQTLHEAAKKKLHPSKPSWPQSGQK